MYFSSERASNKGLKINSECVVACCQGYLGTDVAEIDTNSLFGISKVRHLSVYWSVRNNGNWNWLLQNVNYSSSSLVKFKAFHSNSDV